GMLGDVDALDPGDLDSALAVVLRGNAGHAPQGERLGDGRSPRGHLVQPPPAIVSLISAGSDFASDLLVGCLRHRLGDVSHLFDYLNPPSDLVGNPLDASGGAQVVRRMLIRHVVFSRRRLGSEGGKAEVLNPYVGTGEVSDLRVGP